MNIVNTMIFASLLLAAAYVYMEGILAHEEGSFRHILSYLGIASLCLLFSFLPYPFSFLLSNFFILSFLFLVYHKETNGVRTLIQFYLFICILLLFHTSVFHIVTELTYQPISLISLPSTLFLFSEMFILLPLLIQRQQKQYTLPAFPVLSFLVFLLWLLLCKQLVASTSWLCLYFCLLLVIAILMKQSIRLELLSKRILNEQVTQLQTKENEERYAWLLQENQYMARTIHDMKKHLVLLDTYMHEHEDETLATYRQEVAKQADEMLECLRYGNPMVDRIISIYATKLKEANISLNIEMDDVDISFIEPVDFSAVLMNMLDNALTSCMQAKEKFILLKIKEISPEVLVIKMKNSCDFIKNQEGHLVTSKKDSLYHGFGLKNMEQIAKAYKGAMHTSYDEEHHIFTTTVRFERRE